MPNIISGFQAISRHDPTLSQPPSVIRCLAIILKHIQAVIADNSSDSLEALLANHIGQIIELTDDQILREIITKVEPYGLAHQRP